MKMILNRSGVLIMVTALFFMAVSCESDEPGEQPVLPPLESLKMDFSDFEEDVPASKKSSETYGNFLYSALTVTFWNIYATAVSIVPVTAYGLALQMDPEYLGDQSWKWSFSFAMDSIVTGMSDEYVVSLIASRISNEKFSAVMQIAPVDNPQAVVKFFDGVVRYDHTHASWTIYRNGSLPVLEIEWNNNYETGEGDLKYTYTEPGKPQTNSYIMYENLPGQDFDAAYTVSLAEGMTSIEWNQEALNGRVKSPSHFQDDSWHCWDVKANGFRDIPCK